MAVNVKMGVDLGSFTSGIKEGQQILKGLNAEMKASEAEFKATGNAEQKLTSQTKTLNSQIQVQKGIADQARQALDRMTKAGVDPADAAYQKLYVTLMNAEAGANEAQAALTALGEGAAQAATGADKLATGMNSIGKKMSLDQVISGIDKITSGLENAAKKAADLGEQIWSNIMASAQMSDDILTQASMLDMTPEQYQQYKGVFDTIGEITISEWAATKRKIEKAMVNPSQDQLDVISALFPGMTGGKGSLTQEEVRISAENWEEAFWQIATELRAKVESGQLTSEMADVYGEAMFGKKYSSLKSLIKLGKEGFTEALNVQTTASDEALQKNAELNDQVIKLQNSFDALKIEVTSALAPALTEVAKALDDVLSDVMEYLQTEEGQAMLKQLGDSVSQLFEGMKNINAEDIVNAFKEGFDKVTDALQWVVENKDTVITAIEAIFGFWATLKVSSGVLTILKVINGLKDLAGFGAAGAGTVATGTGTLLSKTVTGIGNLLGNSALMNNAPAVGDWFVHNTGIGQEYILGTKEKGSTLEEIKQNASTFWDDWANNELIKFWTNRDANQGAAGLLPEGADWRPSYMKDQQPVPIETEPEAPADAAEQLAEQVGTVTVPLQFAVDPNYANYVQYADKMAGHANGLWSVPYDGYLARLHKGERVMPAREVASRNYSSNLYVESMIMNGGTDAAGLASAMAAAQRRTMSGYGS